jgi:hypothetical protein
MRRIWWVLVALLWVLPLTGCSKDDPTPGKTAEAYGDAIQDAQDAADAATSRVSEASRQVQDRAGQTVPKGFPIFPGAVPNPEVPGTDDFRWDTAKAIPEVGDYYEEKLGEKPWGVFQSMRASTMAQVIVFKQEGGALPIGRISLKQGPNGEGTTVLLHLE